MSGSVCMYKKINYTFKNTSLCFHILFFILFFSLYIPTCNTLNPLLLIKVEHQCYIHTNIIHQSTIFPYHFNDISTLKFSSNPNTATNPFLLGAGVLAFHGVSFITCIIIYFRRIKNFIQIIISYIFKLKGVLYVICTYIIRIYFREKE